MFIRHIETDMASMPKRDPLDALGTVRGLQTVIPLLRAEPELEGFPPMMSHFSLRWFPGNGLEVGLFYSSQIEKYKVSISQDLSYSFVTLESTEVGLDEVVDTVLEFIGEARRSFAIRPLEPSDSRKVDELVTYAWRTDFIVSRGQIHYPRELPGWVATWNNRWTGLLTYHISDDQCEIVTLEALLPYRGIGSALIAAVCESAKQAGCRRIWLITTNDNMNALHFYQ